MRNFFHQAAGPSSITALGSDSLMPRLLFSTSSVYLPGTTKFWCIGGAMAYSGSSESAIYEVDAITWQWSLVSNLPVPMRCANSMVMSGGYIVTAGGLNGDKRQTAVTAYSYSNKMWMVLNLPVALSETVGVWNTARTEFHILMGGSDASFPYGVNTIYKIDSAGSVTTSGVTIANGSFGACAAPEGNGWWVVFGGYRNGPTTTVFRYNADTGEIDTACGPLPAARYRMVASQLNRSGRLYLYGGQSSGGQHNTVWYYDVATKQVVDTGHTLAANCYLTTAISTPETDYILGSATTSSRAILQYTPVP